MSSENKTIITVVKPFSPPAYNVNLVVFSDNIPYYEDKSAIEHIYKSIKYAKKHNVYTVPCRFLKDGCLMQCMISPDGEILGSQGATHLNLAYRGKINSYNELSIFKTPIGNFALAVDTDIFHCEFARTASHLGANVIIASRYTETINDMSYCTCIGSENMAASNGIYIVDITEEGGRFVTPFQSTCIRNTNFPPQFDKKFYIDFDLLKKENIHSIFLSNKKLFQKYIDVLER
ncbi:MAG: hypothetical protein RSD67_01255 [Oscillospiraceae bacterium]